MIKRRKSTYSKILLYINSWKITDTEYVNIIYINIYKTVDMHDVDLLFLFQGGQKPFTNKQIILDSANFMEDSYDCTTK